jgi:hypothetical protein
LSDQSIASVCVAPGPNTFDYSSTDSFTYKPANNSELWIQQMKESRKLIGVYGYEKLTLPAESGQDLVVDEFKFVRGLSLDSR